MSIRRDLNRYFNGEMSQKEAESFLTRFFSEYSQLEGYMRDSWNEDIKSYNYDSSELIREIRKSRNLEKLPQKKREKRRYRPLKMALACLLLTILGVSSFLVLRTSNQLVQKAIVVVKKTNATGQKSRIRLPDGTLVLLNAESQISYPSEFGDTRKVDLKGEAFFEVKKDKRPFMVKSGRLTAIALGTSFNVNAYTETEREEISLLTGKVKVVDSIYHTEIILEPSSKAIASYNQMLIKEHISEKQWINAWSKGVLHFDNDEFKKVIRILERWYAVEIKISGQSENILCSGTFNNEYLDNVLDVLSHSVGFNYQIRNKQVKINFNKTSMPMN